MVQEELLKRTVTLVAPASKSLLPQVTMVFDMDETLLSSIFDPSKADARERSASFHANVTLSPTLLSSSLSTNPSPACAPLPWAGVTSSSNTRARSSCQLPALPRHVPHVALRLAEEPRGTLAARLLHACCMPPCCVHLAACTLHAPCMHLACTLLRSRPHVESAVGADSLLARRTRSSSPSLS